MTKITSINQIIFTKKYINKLDLILNNNNTILNNNKLSHMGHKYCGNTGNESLLYFFFPKQVDVHTTQKYAFINHLNVITSRWYLSFFNMCQNGY